MPDTEQDEDVTLTPESYELKIDAATAGSSWLGDLEIGDDVDPFAEDDETDGDAEEIESASDSGRNYSDDLDDDDKRAVTAAVGLRSPSVAGVVLFAEDTGRLLMLQRGLDDDDDPAAGTWEFPGGHLEDDEDAWTGAKREWEEEVGQPFPKTDWPVHTWITPNGIYQGFVVAVDEENMVDLRAESTIENPDDDYSEQSAWHQLEHARDNPALRSECRDAPWRRIEQLLPSDRHMTGEGDDVVE